MAILSVPEAFAKFKHRLELTETERTDASNRHRTIRDLLAAKMDVTSDFLTGSYGRDTKTKPLHDVDVFVTFGDVTKADDPNSVLERVRVVLAERYGEDRVKVDRPAVRVDFGEENAGLEDRVMSVEVVPAISENGHYLIGDPTRTGWMATDPSVHATLATDANKAFDGHWKPIIKMLKKWNDQNGDPVEPSFLIEVMGLKLIRGPWTSGYPYELRAYFASAADRIGDEWSDPAGFGSPISEAMTANSLLMDQASAALRDAEVRCGEAIRHDRDGRTGAALEVWQGLFGPLFAKS